MVKKPVLCMPCLTKAKKEGTALIMVPKAVCTVRFEGADVSLCQKCAERYLRPVTTH